MQTTTAQQQHYQHLLHLAIPIQIILCILIHVKQHRNTSIFRILQFISFTNLLSTGYAALVLAKYATANGTTSIFAAKSVQTASASAQANDKQFDTNVSTAQATQVVALLCYMWIPALVSLTLEYVYRVPQQQEQQAAATSSFGLFSWLRGNVIGNRKLWFARMSMVLLTIATAMINTYLPGVQFSHDPEFLVTKFFSSYSDEQKQLLRQHILSWHPFVLIALSIPSSLLAGMTINAFFAYGEERAWRHFLLVKMRKELKWGFWKSSFCIGFIWGLWHWNVIVLMGHNYPEHRYLGIIAMIIMCITISPLYTYFTEQCNTVPYALAPAMMHGVLNGIAALALVYIRGGSELLNGVQGAAGWIANSIACLLLYLFVKLKQD